MKKDKKTSHKASNKDFNKLTREIIDKMDDLELLAVITYFTEMAEYAKSALIILQLNNQ